MFDKTPLAVALRPKTLDDIIGQDHLTKDGIFSRMVATNKLQNVLLWGPPGSGKSSIAHVLAHQTNSDFHKVNATIAGVKELRQILNIAKANNDKHTVLVVDEIHRWTKNVQDVLLDAVENGLVTLIGLTVETAQFAVIKALISRCLILETKPLDSQSMISLIKRVKNHYKGLGLPITIENEAAKNLILRAAGDARKIIMVMETIIEIISDNRVVTQSNLDAVMPNKHLFFDVTGAERYDNAHAYQEAIQNSDTDGAVYWLGKWIVSGEDPAFICRRMLITAFEDCSGNPSAWLAAMAASYTAERTGLPECMIPMSLATIEMAKSKRNKTAYMAIKKVMEDLESREVVHVPPGLRAGTSGYVHAVTRKYVKEWKKDSEKAQSRQDRIGYNPDITHYAIGRKEGPNSYAMHHGPHPDLDEMLQVVGDDNDFIIEFYPHNGEQLNREYAEWVDGKWKEMWMD